MLVTFLPMNLVPSNWTVHSTRRILVRRQLATDPCAARVPTVRFLTQSHCPSSRPPTELPTRHDRPQDKASATHKAYRGSSCQPSPISSRTGGQRQDTTPASATRPAIKSSPVRPVHPILAWPADRPPSIPFSSRPQSHGCRLLGRVLAAAAAPFFPTLTNQQDAGHHQPCS